AAKPESTAREAYGRATAGDGAASMCGIAGFFGRPSPAVPTRALVRRMIAAVAHRGPDAQGFFVDNEIGLGHARLSILDLASGQQPMANADKSVWISFNGEIFN